MSKRTLPAIVVALAALLMSLAPTQASTPSSDRLGGPVRALIQRALLPELLVPTWPTTVEEDQALVEALAAFERRAVPDDLSDLTVYVADRPRSGWNAALRINIGLLYLHYGHFSPALESWKAAWADGKSATDPQARAMVDGAVGELAKLYASFGHMERLAALFEEIGDRPITGSATEAVQVAREQLILVEKDPRHLFICGPMALKMLMLHQGASAERVNFLQWYRAGPDGTNLAEIAGLAAKAGLSYRLVFRRAGEPVPVPAVMHLKVGHFAAIIGETNGRFHVDDPVFSNSGLWMTPAALDAEASGYFLVPANVAPVEPAWRSVDIAEARDVWGKGPTSSAPGGKGDPPANGPPPPLGAGPGGPPFSPPFGPPWPPMGPPRPYGPPAPPSPGGPGAAPGDGACPMCVYDIKESSVSLTLSDVPVGYDPVIGPPVKVRISYNQREASQPQNFSFFNVSPKWTISWLTYITDDPTNLGANVTRYQSGGDAYTYTGFDSVSRKFAAETYDGSALSIVSTTPVRYQRQLRDGSIEIYDESDGSVAFPRRIFLSRVLDPQGNAVTLDYDGQLRLVSLTDAVGRVTTFAYDAPARPLLVTQITDPFGRSAELAYDPFGRLKSITDVIGLTSSFTYNANALVNSMTTPYGTTTFAFTPPGAATPPRFVEVTDPMGFHEREEWLEPAPIPNSDSSASVPQGMPVAPVNNFLSYRNSFHWDKHAYVIAGCTPTGGCDYTKARIRHFTHQPNSSIKSTSLESEKYPLENRVWYNYLDQTSSIYDGVFSQPIAIGRVLDDGTTQLTRYSYDAAGFFKVTQIIDPLGRTTRLSYAGNGIDLLGVVQQTENNSWTYLAQFTYDNRHRPTFYTDAAGQTARFAYNAKGQLTSTTNALGETTTYQYDGNNDLLSITNANEIVAASFTYDAFARVRTYTDSEGWVATYDYDAADRITRITYPDGTFATFTYDKLDLGAFVDRQGRNWTYGYDANRRLTSIVDSLRQEAALGYDEMGRLTSFTDPKSNVTTWSYDVQGRPISKEFADTSEVAYAYESTTSRLNSITDALGQTKEYGYSKDGAVTDIGYLNSVNATPNVSFDFDPFFPRLVSVTDGTGTTAYTYRASFTNGALQVLKECFVPIGGSVCGYEIEYGYDDLGRLQSRSVGGSGVETFGYDAIGRLTAHSCDLGDFTTSYLGETMQPTLRALTGSDLETTWAYLNNLGDRRLAEIGNIGLSSSHHSDFAFTTTPEYQITSIEETSDSATVYPTPTSQDADYNDLDQLIDLSSQSLTYDDNGNLLSDGQRNFFWDAEDRLISISYPSQPGKQTDFSYDGFDRRISISRTPPGGGAASVTSYVWCGTKLCQARNASNTVIRSYFPEGEFVPGSPAQPYYYALDQIGSVRRVFASASVAPTFAFDPWGNPLQATTPLSDFGYAGMFWEPDSGLYLTRYRAYDTTLGRWLSRDPLEGSLGEERTGQQVEPQHGVAPFTNLVSAEGPLANGLGLPHFRTNVAYRTVMPLDLNLYAYVLNDPISLVDPTGEKGIRDFIRVCGIAAGLLLGNPGDRVNTAVGTSKDETYEIDPPAPPPIVGSKDPQK